MMHRAKLVLVYGVMGLISGSFALGDEPFRDLRFHHCPPSALWAPWAPSESGLPMGSLVGATTWYHAVLCSC